MRRSIILNRAGYLSVSGSGIFLFLLVLIVVGFLFSYYCPWSPYYLELTDENGSVLLQLPLDKGEQFILSYSHSVHRTPVRDIFQVSATGEMKLVATEFSSLGVGTLFLPEDGELAEIDGKLVLTGLDSTFKQLQIRPHWLTKHQLLYRQEKYMLTDYVTSGSLVQLEIHKSGLSRLFQVIIERGND